MIARAYSEPRIRLVTPPERPPAPAPRPERWRAAWSKWSGPMARVAVRAFAVALLGVCATLIAYVVEDMRWHEAHRPPMTPTPPAAQMADGGQTRILVMPDEQTAARAWDSRNGREGG